MKRCIVTFLGPKNKPLFDLILYEVTKDEFSAMIPAAAMELLDQRLRRRNMTLEDFEGIIISEPDELPHNRTRHEFATRCILPEGGKVW